MIWTHKKFKIWYETCIYNTQKGVRTMKWRETPKEESTRLHLWIDKDLHKKFRVYALQQDKSMSLLVSELIRKELSRDDTSD